MNWLQRHWDARAAANFMLGGAGSGLMVAALFVADPFSPGDSFSATGRERPDGSVARDRAQAARGARVLQPFTSWMTRESFAALLLFPLGLGALYVPSMLPFAAAAAAAFLYCQAHPARLQGFPHGARPRWWRSSC